MSSSNSPPATATGGARKRDEETAPARSILITSTGPSCDYRCYTLGEYLLNHERCNGSVSYRQRHTTDGSLFVGNLPHGCTEEELVEIFSKFGKINDVRIFVRAFDPNYGFIGFADVESAEKALSAKPILLYGVHRLDVKIWKWWKMTQSDSSGPSGFSALDRQTGSCYLYRIIDGTWAISPALGASDYYYLYNPANTPTLPLSGWRCNLGGGAMKDDPFLTISAAESPPACTVVTISAGPEGTTVLPDYLGDFTPTGKYRLGRPVYRNNKGKYLNAVAGWKVGDGENTDTHYRVTPFSTGSPCPADPRKEYLWSVSCEDHDNGYYYYDKTLLDQDKRLRNLVHGIKTLLQKQTIREIIEGEDEISTTVRIVLNYCCVDIRERLGRDFPSDLYQSLDTPERISTYIRDTMQSGSSGLRKYRLFTVGHQGCGKSSLNQTCFYPGRSQY